MISLAKFLKYIPLAVEAFVYIRDLFHRFSKKRDAVNNEQSDEPVIDQVMTPVQEVLQFLQDNLGKLHSGESSFVKDILSNVSSDEELSPFAKLVKDSLSDGQLTKKEIALIILAYEMNNETLTGQDLAQSNALAEYLGYKTPNAVAMQVGRKVSNLTKAVGQ